VPWDDRVFIKNTTTGQNLLSTFVRYDAGAYGPLAPGGALDRSFAFTLPDGAAGTGLLQIVVTTDINNTVSERNPGGTGESNNDSTLTVTSAVAPYPDLQVANLRTEPATGLQSGAGLVIRWDDANTGNKATAGSWDDQIIIRNKTTNTTLLTTTVHYDESVDGPIAAGGSKARQFAFTLPDGNAGTGQIEITVTTDINNAIFEYNAGGTGESNNATVATVTTTLANYPDLQVTGLAVTPATLQSGANVTVRWTDQNAGNAPTTRFGPTGGDPTGLIAAYYPSTDLTGPATARIDPNINYDFGATPPPTGGTTNFSVRWLGQIQAQFSETYTFYTYSDDGVRLWVNNQLLIDNFTLHSGTENSGTIALQAGQKYDIRVEYFQGPGSAVMTLSWSSPSTAKAVVPASALSHPTGGGFYDRVLVENTTRTETLLDQFVYYDPTAPGAGDIEAGGGRARSLTLRLPADAHGVGDLRFTVTADAANYVKEFTTGDPAEGNNSASLTRTSVPPSQLPDLVVPQASLTATPAAPKSGQQVTVRWSDANTGVTATNGSWTDSVTVRNATTNVVITTGTVPYDAAARGNLAPGATAAQQFQFNLPDGDAGVGNIVISVTVDANNDQAEGNADGTAETNNTTTLTIAATLADYPDLVVPQSSVTLTPAQPSAGSPLTITWADQNAGAGDVTRSFIDHVTVVNTTTGHTLLDVNVPYDVTALGALKAGATSGPRQTSFTLPNTADGLGALTITSTTTSSSTRPATPPPRRITALRSPPRRSPARSQTWLWTLSPRAPAPRCSAAGSA
jgi:hypothetical protein